MFIDEVEGIKRRIIDEAGGRVCNPTLDPDTEAITLKFHARIFGRISD